MVQLIWIVTVSPGLTYIANLGEKHLWQSYSLYHYYYCKQLPCSLVSQSGYVVVDDTNRPQFDSSPWPWVLNKTYPTPSEKQCSSVDHDQVNLYICMIT